MSADVFVDTNILIYAHDRSAGDKHYAAKDLIASHWLSGGASLSVQVLQELYVNLTKKLTGIAPADAVEITKSYTQWRVHRPSARDVIAGAELHIRHQLSFWDAMIVTSAKSLGCEKLLTEDLSHGQFIMGVNVENPFSTPERPRP